MLLLDGSSSIGTRAATATMAARSAAGRSVVGGGNGGISARRPTIRRRSAALGDDDDEYEFSGGGPDPMASAGEFLWVEQEGEKERRFGPPLASERSRDRLTTSPPLPKNRTPADALSPLTNWLRSPTDLLTFGPRAALGALLSLPRAQERLAGAAERAQELLQDPRPPLEKAASAAKAAAEEVAGLVETGAGAEARAISAALEVLPADVVSALPADFLAAVERASGGEAGGVETAASGSSGSSSFESGVSPSSSIAPSDADRAAEEAATLASAAARVAEAAGALAAAKSGSGGGAQRGMARLNAREARAALARALEQASSATSSASPEVADAAKLLDELDEALLAVAG